MCNNFLINTITSEQLEKDNTVWVQLVYKDEFIRIW